MLFSIVVPVYNVEKYLKECISSILNQSFNDYELILVDDGSTDASGKICDEYASSDSRIKVIHKPNGGLVSARQSGISVATGDYVIAVDSDDCIELGMLELISSAIRENNYPDMICCDHNVYKNGEKIPVSTWLNGGYYDRNQIENLLPCLIRGENGRYFPPQLWAKAVKRDIMTKNQMNIYPKITVGEDACVIFACLLEIQSMFCIKKPVYNYRVNMSSITRSRTKGFSWDEITYKINYFTRILPLDKWDFQAQLYRSMTHHMFIIAKSHLQTKRNYFEVRKEIRTHFSNPVFVEYVKKCKFKGNFKESFAAFLVRHKLVFGIKLISMIIK